MVAKKPICRVLNCGLWNWMKQGPEMGHQFALKSYTSVCLDKLGEGESKFPTCVTLINASRLLQ